MPTEEELMARAAELLARGPLLPPPAERKRLREAASLTQEDVAIALQTKRETVNGWETGRTKPRPPRLAAYKHLLDGWAKLYPPADTGAPNSGSATFTGPADPATQVAAESAVPVSGAAATITAEDTVARPGTFVDVDGQV
ncbi:helix-turn-helix transcriptional regulator [Streptomyces chartreusis]